MTSRHKPFAAPGWIFEYKYDGFRCLARRGSHAQVLTRHGRDLSHAFPDVLRELERLPPGSALDGELVVLDGDGDSQFDRLHERSLVTRREGIAAAARRCPAAFVTWDALALEGRDLRKLALLRRKMLLRRAVHGMRRIRIASHVPDSGTGLFADALLRELDGIVGKRADSRYTAGRSLDWVKIKTPIGRERDRLRRGLRRRHG